MNDWVRIPINRSADYDFIAFTFNGKHSYEDFGIIRTIDGNRYNDNLMQINDITADVPNGDGMYYFNTTIKQRNFNINFAFENMADQKLRELKQWLSGKEMGELWFAETPYKIWTAKVTGQSSINYIPFEKTEINGNSTITKRVYSGEGSVTFTAYWPYAHTPKYVVDDVFTLKRDASSGTAIVNQTQSLRYYIEIIEPKGVEVRVALNGRKVDLNGGSWDYGTTQIIKNSQELDFTSEASYVRFEEVQFGINTDSTISEIKCKVYYYDSDGKRQPFLFSRGDGRKKNSYTFFPNYDQWKDQNILYPGSDSAGMGENYGDIITPFKLSLNRLDASSSEVTLKVGTMEVKISAGNSYTNLVWDSKTGLITANKSTDAASTSAKPIVFTGNPIGGIPIYGLTNAQKSQLPSGATLEYSYWYY